LLSLPHESECSLPFLSVVSGGESVALFYRVGGQGVRPRPISRQNWGEDMNQESSLNLVDRYGESLHSSEVFNPRELKFCEGCGLLLIRLQGSKVQFCADCERQMAIAAGRLQ